MAANDKIAKFRDLKKPSTPGVYHRLIVMTGDSKGEGFILKSNRIVIGRGDTADVKISDLKSSREHAELTKIGDKYIVTDLGSQNGVYVNDLKITQHKLKEGDKIVIGKTVLKYGSLEVVDKFKQPEKEEVQEEEVEETPQQDKKKLIIGGAIILVFGLMLGGDDEAPVQTSKSARKVKSISEDFIEAAKKKELEEDKELKEKMNVIFQRGLRESREGNYFRAISEFNLALILNPGNARAKYYLEKTKKILDDQIERNFKKARRDFDALKYAEAQIAYCAIIRLLRDYPEDERYVAAQENLYVIEEKLGLEKGEINCF